METLVRPFSLTQHEILCCTSEDTRWRFSILFCFWPLTLLLIVLILSPVGFLCVVAERGRRNGIFAPILGVYVCVSDVGAIIHFFPNIFYLMLYKQNIILQHLTTINSELDYFLYLFFLHLEQHAPIWTSHIYGEEETPWD